jgi:hypothetical protein
MRKTILQIEMEGLVGWEFGYMDIGGLGLICVFDYIFELVALGSK